MTHAAKVIVTGAAVCGLVLAIVGVGVVLEIARAVRGED